MAKFESYTLSSKTDDKLAKFFSYFLLVNPVDNNSSLIAFYCLSDSYSGLTTNQHAEEIIENILVDAPEVKLSRKIDTCLEIPSDFDFMAGVKKYMAQLAATSNVTRTGQITSQNEYHLVRDHRNLVRKFHDFASGARAAGVYLTQIKRLDNYLEVYERNNPGIEDSYTASPLASKIVK